MLRWIEELASRVPRTDLDLYPANSPDWRGIKRGGRYRPIPKTGSVHAQEFVRQAWNGLKMWVSNIGEIEDLQALFKWALLIFLPSSALVQHRAEANAFEMSHWRCLCLHPIPGPELSRNCQDAVYSRYNKRCEEIHIFIGMCFRVILVRSLMTVAVSPGFLCMCCSNVNSCKRLAYYTRDRDDQIVDVLQMCWTQEVQCKICSNSTSAEWCCKGLMGLARRRAV